MYSIYERISIMTGLAKRAAIYARTATVQEREPQLALATQIHDCVEYAANQGYLILEGLVYQETCSGLSLNRPALTALREAAKRGEFDVLLVFTSDRISRNQSDTVKI